MLDGIIWFLTNIGLAFVNVFRAVSNPSAWLDWSQNESLGRFIYYGASHELFFVILDIFIIVTAIGLWRRNILWGVVRALEWIANSIGRFAAYAALFMVLQQIMIIFLQRIFRVADISIGPFGYVFTKDLSWFGEELKLYNAMIVALCASYTFVQGGHVRVDLFYAGMKYRTKKIVDMLGSLIYIIPSMTMIWMFGWFYLWRALVTPKMAVSDKFELLMRKSKLLKWNVETIGFSPNGFDAYFLFKILLIAFAGLMFLQGIAFFYRSMLELIEGPESEGKYRDIDVIEDDTARLVAEIH
ncbi:MAG: TRAP transporter small permease subunit [Paracoccaceae bacterium]